MFSHFLVLIVLSFSFGVTLPKLSSKSPSAPLISEAEFRILEISESSSKEITSPTAPQSILVEKIVSTLESPITFHSLKTQSSLKYLYRAHAPPQLS